ncbi:hypothetical protein KY338_03750 [Candidatus Woesearchaeota archaeon]|nr:hypothetical protein [Candidatus Woesearchaeota archaeon]MBW3005426.1 hypothetical protein [Candidatus Woesearchaeota archaeon]
MGLKKSLPVFLLAVFILVLPSVQGDVIFKNAEWKNDTFLELTMEKWSIIPSTDFHASQAHEETSILYRDESFQLWKLVLDDYGIIGDLGWYDNCNKHGKCERGVCKEGLSCNADACVNVSEGEYLYTDDDSCDHYDTREYRTGYKCEVYSATGGHPVVFYCRCNGNKIGAGSWCDNGDGETYNTRWVYTTEAISGEADTGGLDCGGLLESKGFNYEEGCDCCYDSNKFEYKQYYKAGLSNADLDMLFNHTRCWIKVTQARNNGNDFLTYAIIEGIPETNNDFLSCLINYSDWQEIVTDDNSNAADIIAPGSKLYFDFEGNDLELEPECYSNADCGENYWTGEPECCNGDGWHICQAYHGYECQNAGTSKAFCFEWDGYKQVEECVTECKDNMCPGEPEEPSNETNATGPVEPDPINDTCEDCINVSEIADKAVESIKSIKNELRITASLIDREVGGTSAEFTNCMWAAFAESAFSTMPNMNSLYPFKDQLFKYGLTGILDGNNISECWLENILNEDCEAIFSEYAYSDMINNTYSKEFDRLIEEIQQLDFNEVQNIEFVKDVLANFDLYNNLTISEKEKIESIIQEGNTMQFQFKIILLGQNIFRLVLIGKTNFNSIKMFELFKFGSGTSADIESCTYEAYAQAKINYVLNVFMKNMIEQTIYRANEIKEATEYLNSAEELPSITVQNNGTILVKNAFSKPLIIKALFDENMKAQGYCGAIAMGTGGTNIPSKTGESELLYPEQTSKFEQYYTAEFKQELDGINLNTYCPLDCYGQTDAGTSAKIEGEGYAYVFYGDNNTIAVKRVPIKTVYKTLTCKKAIGQKPKVYSSGGGGGGGGSSSSTRTTQPLAVITKPVTGTSLAEKWAGGGGNTVTSTPEPALKAPEKEPEPLSEPKTEEKKQETIEPKAEENVVINTVKSMGQLLIQTILPWLNWLNLF